MKDISTDKVIAIGLVICCGIYALSTVFLGVSPSEALLGTIFGGLIGVLKGNDEKKKGEVKNEP